MDTRLRTKIVKDSHETVHVKTLTLTGTTIFQILLWEDALEAMEKPTNTSMGTPSKETLIIRKNPHQKKHLTLTFLQYKTETGTSIKYVWILNLYYHSLLVNKLWGKQKVLKLKVAKWYALQLEMSGSLTILRYICPSLSLLLLPANCLPKFSMETRFILH